MFLNRPFRMDVGSFTFRDWALFLGAYVVWCLPAVLAWNIARKRSKRSIVRAILFGVLFAPGVVPIVREAYVIGPAILGLGYMALQAVFEPKFIMDFISNMLLWSIAPIFAVTVIYLVVARQRLFKLRG
jgi:hypothetical protein